MLMYSCKLEVDLFIWITSGLNVVGDIYLLIIPLSAVAKLHLPLRQKLGAFAVFFTGLLYVHTVLGGASIELADSWSVLAYLESLHCTTAYSSFTPWISPGTLLLSSFLRMSFLCFYHSLH